MRFVQLTLWLALCLALVAARTDPDQTPICHKCEENKPKPKPVKEIPRCTRNRQRPQPSAGQCVITYSCSGHCGSLSIPGVSSLHTLECDYAEVSVAPDGSIISECCDPPECPSCPKKPDTNNDHLGCPAMDGSIVTFGGKAYIYHCNSNFCASTTSSVCETTTLKECAERCAHEPTCVMASYDSKTKTCTLATKVGSIETTPGSGSVVLEPISDNNNNNNGGGSDCARLDNTRVTIKGMEFLLHCDTRVTDSTCTPHPAKSYSDCAALCATDAKCNSASFASGHCCVSDKKPAKSGEKGSIGLTPQPGYGCPYVDWAVKEIGGKKYEYHCDAWLESGGKWSEHTVANEMECALLCSKDKHCTGISLRGQSCYLANAGIVLKPKGDWVALVPVDGGVVPPKPPKPGKDEELTVGECREAHGKEAKYKGHTYTIDCYRWVGSDGFATATKSKLGDCIKMCADHANCVALHYLPSQQFCAIHDNIPRVGTQGDYGVAYVRRIG